MRSYGSWLPNSSLFSFSSSARLRRNVRTAKWDATKTIRTKRVASQERRSGN